MQKTNLIVSLLFCTLFCLNIYAGVIPTRESNFYYNMGGGQSIPAPAYSSAYSLPLRADNVSNYNCGLFDSQFSITNSLNGIANSFQNIQQSVIRNATAAIMEFPMYILSRADPSLYNLLNNGLLSAQQDLGFSTKNCQAMKSDINRGQNPYENWANVSMGNDWKYQMSLTNGGQFFKSSGSLSNDINLVNKKIEEDNGKNGVPWVQGIHTGRSGKYAGGRGQPAILVLHDASVAGYNVVLQSKRAYDDKNTPIRTDANAHLVDTWTNPVLAADWIVSILGDEKVTTFNGGDKQVTPGVGLLPDNKRMTTVISVRLQNLVADKDKITLEKLQAVSAPGLMINSNVILAIREQTPLNREIFIDKLAQEIATAQLIDKALLAYRILLNAKQIPDIHTNAAAQATIKQGLDRLKQEIESLLFNINVHKALVSETVIQLLNQTQHQQKNHVAVQPSAAVAPILNQGAIRKNNEINAP
ncbi:MAG TPA: integrating conjugative element protein [Gammaproteobacteria bacterium]|nr:integrating conjugative element protein [Gammaproteobacteria bacterium]